jgi:hypothetical protein
MAYARWRHMLIESQRHAFKAMDEWNCSSGNFGDFLTHMHKAWHYEVPRTLRTATSLRLGRLKGTLVAAES